MSDMKEIPAINVSSSVGFKVWLFDSARLDDAGRHRIGLQIMQCDGKHLESLWSSFQGSFERAMGACDAFILEMHYFDIFDATNKNSQRLLHLHSDER
jgi:hypothetical protein